MENKRPQKVEAEEIKPPYFKSNAINFIVPYKHRGQWVFDDEKVGLDKEPFVAGADIMLDMLSNGADTIGLTFSGNYFPGSEHTLYRQEDYSDQDGGTYYEHEQTNHRLWLCPALLKYFKYPPLSIHFQVTSVE